MNKTDVLHGLYGITDVELLSGQSLIPSIEEALAGGLKIVQYRNKTQNYTRKLEQARKLKKSCQAYQALLIINDDVRLAREVNADGVHLGSDDASMEEARQVLGEQAIIGCSCYNQLDLALRAQDFGADYVAFGRFYASKTKPQAVQAAVDILQQAKNLLDIPVCAIGGITLDNAAPLIEQGADMIAVIHGLFGADDIHQRAGQFCRLFQ